MNRPVEFHRALHLAAGAWLLAVAAPSVQADSAPAPTETLETVTVFGSPIGNRTVFDSPVPIDVYSPEDVQRALNSGELGQALQSLSPAINMPRASASGTSDAVRAFQLRGLAPDQVLVLVNGRRRHTSAVMDFEGAFHGTVAVDINNIPADAIDHIEVLRDGAGAIYGSDAVAGVVNIVLKSGAGRGGIEASFGENRTYFAPTESTISDGRNRIIRLSDGFGFADGGWLQAGAEYQKRGGTNRAGRSSAGWTSWNSTDADLALDNQVLFRSGDPDLESKALFYNASLPLAGGPELYSFATLNSHGTEGSAFFRYPGDPTNVASIYPNGFLPVSTNDSRDLGVVAGVRGHASLWKWDLSVRDGYNTFSYGLRHSLNASLGASSPTSFHLADFTFDQRAINLDLTGAPPVAAFAGPLNLAAGAEYLREAYHTTPGDPASYAAGPSYHNEFGEPIPPGAQGDSGLRPQDAVHISRHVTSVYVDVDSEVVSRLLLGAAARYSNYSDYGSSTTGKFSVRYNLTDDFLLRASVSSSFRAPALAQTGIRFATLNFNAAGDGLQNNAWLPPSDPLAQLFGARPLTPERSVNETIGLAFRSAGTYATLDLYQIRIRDRITPTGSLQSDAVSQFLADHGINDIASVTFLTNALDTTTRGFDLVVGHDTSFAGGELRLSASFNHNDHRVDRLRNGSAALAAIDPTLSLSDPTVLVPLLYGSPSSKLILTADWSGERWGAHAAATRFGELYAFSYDSAAIDLNGLPVQRYAPAWSVDLDARYHFTHALTGTIGGTDVFNRYPDRTLEGGTYGGAFPYSFYHALGINGAYFYASLNYRFGR